jgi:hypothetical protein
LENIAQNTLLVKADGEAVRRTSALSVFEHSAPAAGLATRVFKN